MGQSVGCLVQGEGRVSLVLELFGATTAELFGGHDGSLGAWRQPSPLANGCFI
jgi:hypothetical protein